MRPIETSSFILVSTKFICEETEEWLLAYCAGGVPSVPRGNP